MPQIYTPTDPVHWSWIPFEGPDAEDFLHRLTTVNMRQLPEGSGSPGCFLNPQGKIRAYFTLWRVGPQNYAFEFDSGQGERWKSELLTVIDQFTFAEKLSVRAASDFKCRWIFDAPLEIPSGTTSVQAGVRVCNHGSSQFGKSWLSVWAEERTLETWMREKFPQIEGVLFETLQSWRISQVSPWIDSEITEGVVALEVGLKEAIASNKGCYPGQEVIEKILALGSPARRLVLLEGSGERPHPGDALFTLAENPIEVGKLTSVAREGQGFEFRALALIRKIHAKENLELKLGASAKSESEHSHLKISRVAPYA